MGRMDEKESGSGMEKVVNIDELKPGAETDRLVAEAIRSECVIAGNTVFLDTERFQPSDDLNAAFWVADQVGLFDDYPLGRGYDCWELSRFPIQTPPRWQSQKRSLH